ncbi:hypothetical protein JCM8547_003713 [Rhodosporidiobolus lusitaniae]
MNGMHEHLPLATTDSDDDPNSGNDALLPSSTAKYPPQRSRRSHRRREESSSFLHARLSHVQRLVRTHPVPSACLALFSLALLIRFSGPFSRPSTSTDDKNDPLSHLPLLAFPDGTRYSHPLPPSHSDPWPHRPEIASRYLIPSSQRSSVSVLKEYDLPASYVNASNAVWVEKRRGWREAGLNDGEGFDDITGRPLKVPRDVVYDGRRAGWRAHAPAEPIELSKVQHTSFVSGRDPRTKEEKEQDEHRREWVKRAFEHLWARYKEKAWGYDELRPLSGGKTNAFSGWSATIFDALDTLLITGLHDEYLLARAHVARVDFSYTSPRNPAEYPVPSSAALPPLSFFDEDIDELYSLPAALGSRAGVPTFETVIRHLGSLLSSYDLSHDPLMLARARDLGEWLLPSLATESGLLVPTYRLGAHSNGGPLGPVCLAEAGSVGLELVRLSQVTGDPVFAEAAQRSLDALDNWPSSDRLPGLFPTMINVADPHSLHGTYTFGGQADSYYEYLIKIYQLLGGSPSRSSLHPHSPSSTASTPPAAQYARMYTAAIDSAHEYLVRPINVVPGLEGAVTIGDLHFKEENRGRVMSWFSMRLDHLTCFAGGMLGLGSRLLHRSRDMETAVKFTKACTWAYSSTSTGLAPEIIELWSEQNPQRWSVVELADGTTAKTIRGDPAGVYHSSNYHIQRPETIESVFYMYRLTGDRKYQDQAWTMFTSWVSATISSGGFSHIKDVNAPGGRAVWDDSGVESFVYGETLKYYYLIFSPPDFLSLDDWVFSTEAHPFRLRTPTPSSHPSSTNATAPFWPSHLPPLSARPEGVREEEMGEGTSQQKWARMVQAAAMKGWDWRWGGRRATAGETGV